MDRTAELSLPLKGLNVSVFDIDCKQTMQVGRTGIKRIRPWSQIEKGDYVDYKDPDTNMWFKARVLEVEEHETHADTEYVPKEPRESFGALAHPQCVRSPSALPIYFLCVPGTPFTATATSQRTRYRASSWTDCGRSTRRDRWPTSAGERPSILSACCGQWVTTFSTTRTRGRTRMTTTTFSEGALLACAGYKTAVINDTTQTIYSYRAVL